MYVTTRSNTFRRGLFALIVATLLIGVVFAGFLYLSAKNSPLAFAAQDGMTFTKLNDHPNASRAGYLRDTKNYYTQANLCPDNDLCPVGRTIVDMEVTADGKLISGYGDWDSNLDSFTDQSRRIGIIPLDLSTNTWGDMFFTGSEANDVIRKINGHLYVPTTDPSDKAATGNATGNKSGYATNETGQWTFVDNKHSDLHVFDVAERTPGEKWTSGSNETFMTQGAAAWKSSDNGTNWTLGLEGTKPSLARYYWIASLDNKVYLQDSNHTRAQQYDGTSWTTTASFDCATMSARLVVVFKDHIICNDRVSRGIVNAFDGTSVTSLPPPPSQILDSLSTIDYYVTDSHLYMLTNDGIFRIDDINGSWERMTYSAASIGASSLAIYNDKMYLGKTDGTIWHSEQLISEMVPPTHTIESCLVFNPSKNAITGYRHTDPRCPTDEINLPGTIGGYPVTTIESGAFQGLGLTSVTFADTIQYIGTNAFARNQLQTVVLPRDLISIGDSAFLENKLTSIDFPDSLKTIGTQAFYDNQLTTLTLPASLETASLFAFVFNPLDTVFVEGNPRIDPTALHYTGFSLSSVPSEYTFGTAEYFDYVEQHSSFVRLYASNPDFLASYGDQLQARSIVQYDEETWEPIGESVHFVSGVLVNPASIETSYVDSRGASLRPASISVSPFADLNDYRLASALPYLTMSTNAFGVTTTTFADGDPYYRFGSVIDVPAQATAGFVSPPSQRVTLTQAQNNVRMVYLTEQEIASRITIGPDGSVVLPNAPNTGLERTLSGKVWGMTGLFALLLGIVLTVRNLMLKRRKV